MYELVSIAGNTHIIQSPTNVGLVRTGEGEAVLIDSGNDKEAGRKIRQVLDSQGLRLAAIFNTHSHADHIGGNRYLQGQTGCRIYAPGTECCFTRHPILEPTALYGGCPPPELRHKMLMAQESDASPLTPEALPDGFEIVPLPGHSMDMVGFRTPDDVVFLGDCLASARTLDKYGVVFLHDVGAYMATLERVEGMDAVSFVPAHAEPTEDIVPLARLNIERTLEVADRIESICSDAKGFDGILKEVFDAYSLRMDAIQHALVGGTVRSYLTWLKEKGRVDCHFEDNTMLWQSLR